MPYQPKFQDGWSPGIIEFSDDDEEDGFDSDTDTISGDDARKNSVIEVRKLNGHKVTTRESSLPVNNPEV